MTPGFTITKDVHFHIGRGSRKILAEGRASEQSPVMPGRIPRISRLMALALRLERLVKAGEVADYAALAELGHVTRARMTQIMNLLNLAPDIQEEILFLPCIASGRDPIRERGLRPIAGIMDWRKQRKIWRLISVSATTANSATSPTAARRGQRPSVGINAYRTI
jgi:hypothetical protein